MDVMEAIRTRRSVRGYLDKPVEDEKLNAVLEAARLAPSARNSQDWKFVVVRGAERRQKIMAAAKGQVFVGQAPVVIACCAMDAERVMSCGQKAGPINVAIAVDHMTLAAVELGLGTCWVCAFDEAPVKEILGIPDGPRVIALLTLGYPESAPPPTARKSMDEIVCHEEWS
ncbi:MAG: nitroreductase [Planctomycetes bacterium]|nr:nitroreductase [Planctomycetota bacterium]